MTRIATPLTLGFLLALTACPGDDSGTTTDTDAATAGSTTSSTGTSPDTTTSESADTTDGTTDPGTTTDTPGTTTDMPGTTTDESGSTTDDPGTTGEMGGVCEPDPADDACGACVKAQCCMELEACGMDADCTCFQDCAAMNPGMAGALGCANTCMIPLPDLFNDMIPVGALANCTQDNCGKCL